MSVLAVVLLIAGILTVAALLWGFRILRSRDGFAEFIRRRKMTATISSMAEWIHGGNHVPVALTLERTHIFYESSFLDARLEIARLDEIEYDSEQGTGEHILRLRARGQSFEFVLDPAAASRWEAVLPAFRTGSAATVGPAGFPAARLAGVRS